MAAWWESISLTTESTGTNGRGREPILLLAATLFVGLNGLALGLQRPMTALPLLGSIFCWFLSILALQAGLNRRQPSRDPYLLPIFALLTGWGLIVIARLAPNFLWRQTIWLLMATVALFAVAVWPRDLRMLRRYRYTWLTLGILLLATTFVWGVNPSGAGASLWLPLPFIGNVFFQPSELLKLLLLVFLASYFEEREQILAVRTRPGNAWPFLAPLLLMWGFCTLLLVWQRDLGAATIFYILFLSLLFLATGRWRYIWLGLILLGGVSILAMVLFGGFTGWTSAEALADLGSFGRVITSLVNAARSAYDVVALRVGAWWNPWPDADASAFQIVQALYAVGAGGVWGQGIAQGLPEFIPVVHSDFAFAAIAEEWGLLGSLTVVVCYALLAQRGLRIAAAAWRPFRYYLAAGIVVLFTAQALLIMGGVTKLLPLTGVTLPFVSYGGSSLLVSSIMIGLLLNVAPRSVEAGLEADTGPLRPVTGHQAAPDARA